MATFNTRKDLIAAVDAVLLTSNILPANCEEIVKEMRRRFECVNPSKSLYWKETPNGILSVNSDSIMFLKKDGTKEVVFELGLDDPNAFYYSHRKVWLMVYCLIWPLQALNEDSKLQRWLAKSSAI